MSDSDKLICFGRWLTERQAQYTADLASLALNAKAPVDALRIKAGHLEAATMFLNVFRELYNGDINKFQQDYFGAVPATDEAEDKE